MDADAEELFQAFRNLAPDDESRAGFEQTRKDIGDDESLMAFLKLHMLLSNPEGLPIQYDLELLAKIPPRSTKRAWRQRIWPKIGRFFEVRDGLIYHRDFSDIISDLQGEPS